MSISNSRVHHRNLSNRYLNGSATEYQSEQVKRSDPQRQQRLSPAETRARFDAYAAKLYGGTPDQRPIIHGPDGFMVNQHR